jgi:hypothetical protein
VNIVLDGDGDGDCDGKEDWRGVAVAVHVNDDGHDCHYGGKGAVD